jgi:hypothetical protein
VDDFIDSNVIGDGIEELGVDGSVLVGKFLASHVSELGGSESELLPGARETLRNSSNAAQYINIHELYQFAYIGEGGEDILMKSQFSVCFAILTRLRSSLILMDLGLLCWFVEFFLSSFCVL